MCRISVSFSTMPSTAYCKNVCPPLAERHFSSFLCRHLLLSKQDDTLYAHLFSISVWETDCRVRRSICIFGFRTTNFSGANSRSKGSSRRRGHGAARLASQKMYRRWWILLVLKARERCRCWVLWWRRHHVFWLRVFCWLCWSPAGIGLLKRIRHM